MKDFMGAFALLALVAIGSNGLASTDDQTHRCFVYGKPGTANGKTYPNIAIGKSYLNSKNVVTELDSLESALSTLAILQEDHTCPLPSNPNPVSCYIYVDSSNWNRVAIGMLGKERNFHFSRLVFEASSWDRSTNLRQAKNVAEMLKTAGQCDQIEFGN